MRRPLRILAVVLGVILVPLCVSAETHLKLCVNPAWRFQLDSGTNPVAADYDDSKWDLVSLPHSHRLFPVGLTGYTEHGREVGWYRRHLQVPQSWLEKKVFVEFQGAMQATTVWVNGKPAGNYSVSGYDPFSFDITPHLRQGDNVIAVKVDNRRNPEIPPDGVLADYILFGGLYRDVFIHVTDPIHFTFPWEAHDAGIRVGFPEISADMVTIELTGSLRNESGKARTCTLAADIFDKADKRIESVKTEFKVDANSGKTIVLKAQPIQKPHLWSPEDPYLYRIETKILEEDVERDSVRMMIGVRWVKFDHQKGFFLNGKSTKLIGANRHQTWPFIGGAVPNSLHRDDAQQMKAMGINWVRLSHYPQDPDFLDALDELGLMAVAEGPTWMSTGQGKWMQNLEASFRSMIRRDRNHPCIILWNASINHQAGSPRLVQAAKEEDPTRDRGQDNVDLPMNFQPGIVSGSGALCIEHTGHTFPASRGARFTSASALGREYEPFITFNREYEQAMRHAEQVNSALAKEDCSGAAVWCMYDYNTFHNVDEPGAVWHGVCDIFRIPKLSYWWHVSELTTNPMLRIVRVDQTRVDVLSNCRDVRLWQDLGNGYTPVTQKSPEYLFPSAKLRPIALKHPPTSYTVAAGAVAFKAEAVDSSSATLVTEWKPSGNPAALRLETDRDNIVADGSDLTRIVVTAVDTNGIPVESCQSLVAFRCDGIGQLIGENPTTLRNGKAIILLQSGFIPDTITLRTASKGLRPGKIVVSSMPVSERTDLPKNLPVKQPSPRDLFGCDPVSNKNLGETNKSHF